jgi:hypothetical protein
LKEPASGLSQQAGEAGGSLTLEAQGRVGSSPDNDGTDRHRQTIRVRQARRKNEISAAGFVILGLDLRSDGGGTTPAGLSTEISWSSYRRNSERGTASIDAARQQATEALRRPDLTEFEGYQWVLVTWTSA